jgi:hypothetical protein
MDSPTEANFIALVKRGAPVSGTKVLECRTKGLAAIRRECLARLSRLAGLPVDSSLIARWRGLGERANSRTVSPASFELVLHSGPTAITGSFSDLWIICYPDDPESKREIEAVMDRMCQDAVKRQGS